MELIPILSTIILVATISTFMLAVGAYILYKVRERKGSQASAQQPAEVKAELITPASAPSQQPQPSERVYAAARKPKTAYFYSAKSRSAAAEIYTGRATFCRFYKSSASVSRH